MFVFVLGAVGGAALARRRRGAGAAATTARLEHQVQVQAAELRRIADQGAQRELSSEQLRQGLDGARRALEELRTRDQERRMTDQEQRDVVRRLATVLAGGAAKGRAGENVLREHLADLPPACWSPISGSTARWSSSGWRCPTAGASRSTRSGQRSPSSRRSRPRPIRSNATPVRARSRAVGPGQGGRAVLDPGMTSPVAVAAVPDAAYASLKRVHADAYGKGVVIVPYAWALPIVLFLYALVRRFGDTAGLQASLTDVAAALDALEAVVENRFQKAAAMLSNGADAFRSDLGKARGSISRAQVTPALYSSEQLEPNLSVVG